jgi:hypothetical protein
LKLEELYKSICKVDAKLNPTKEPIAPAVVSAQDVIQAVNNVDVDEFENLVNEATLRAEAAQLHQDEVSNINLTYDQALTVVTALNTAKTTYSDAIDIVAKAKIGFTQRTNLYALVNTIYGKSNG